MTVTIAMHPGSERVEPSPPNQGKINQTSLQVASKFEAESVTQLANYPGDKPNPGTTAFRSPASGHTLLPMTLDQQTPRTLHDNLVFGEGPRFYRGALYVADQHGGALLRFEQEGPAQQIAHIAQGPSGIGFAPDGTMLVVSMRDRKLLSIASDGRPTERADLSAVATGHCNDMVVDSYGRAYVGNFGFDMDAGEAPRAAQLALVEPGGQVSVVADDLMFPNGMAITPDGNTLIVAETYRACLTAFDVKSNGQLRNRRIWAQLSFPPDGICLDAAGCVWAANPMNDGGYHRIAEGGNVLGSVSSGDRVGIACMLGGPDRRSLFMLDASTFDPHKTHPGNSRLRVIDVEVPGAGYPATS